MNSKLIKVIGLTATLIGLGTSLITDWCDEKTMEETVEKKVNEALARKNSGNEEES